MTMLRIFMGDNVIEKTDFEFPGQVNFYKGKVRDVYDFGDKLLMVSTDRYSAFDRNLALIPNKGELLSSITKWWFEKTEHIIKNHAISYPDPNAILCKKFKVLPLEMIVRGYITGVTNTSLWVNYEKGQRDFGDFVLPEGLTKNQKLPEPVLTPTTKFEDHDRPLTPAEAVSEGLIDEETYLLASDAALRLFKFGQETAEKNGLILVDTKYEFGIDENNQLVLIDEIHTPDSSRYWLKKTYREKIDADEEPENYDKEYLRLWFKKRFNPYEDKEAPEVPNEIIEEMSKRYVFVFEALTGKKFKPAGGEPIKRIENNVLEAI